MCLFVSLSTYLSIHLYVTIFYKASAFLLPTLSSFIPFTLLFTNTMLFIKELLIASHCLRYWEQAVNRGWVPLVLELNIPWGKKEGKLDGLRWCSGLYDNKVKQCDRLGGTMLDRGIREGRLLWGDGMWAEI